MFHHQLVTLHYYPRVWQRFEFEVPRSRISDVGMEYHIWREANKVVFKLKSSSQISLQKTTIKTSQFSRGKAVPDHMDKFAHTCTCADDDH